MENILFKVSFPAEFHAQTAVEAAFQLHPQVKDRLDEIEKVVITTQESAMRIIDKRGPLYNPADRDHCIQYMTAIGLIFGDLTAEHYEDAFAADPRIDALREKMEVRRRTRSTAAITWTRRNARSPMPSRSSSGTGRRPGRQRWNIRSGTGGAGRKACPIWRPSSARAWSAGSAPSRPGASWKPSRMRRAWRQCR